MLYVYNNFAYIEEYFDTHVDNVYTLPSNIDINSIIASSTFRIDENNNIKVYKDENVYVGNLIDYSDNKVIINEDGNTIIIRNYDHIEQNENDLKITFSEKNHFTKIMYRVDDIKSKTEYILHVIDDKIVNLVESMTIDNRWHDVYFDKIFFISGIDDHQYIHRSFNNVSTTSLMDNRSSDSNKNLDDYRIYTHEISGKLDKNTLMYTPREIGAHGIKAYIIDSNYIEGPIRYGYEVTPSENIYNYPGKIIDAKTNIILSNIIFPKIQNNNTRLILAGTTTAIIVNLTKKMSIDSYKFYNIYDYTFNIHLQNENDYEARIYFKHTIEFDDYMLITEPDIIEGNNAIWEIDVPSNGIIIQTYQLSLKVKDTNS